MANKFQLLAAGDLNPTQEQSMPSYNLPKFNTTHVYEEKMSADSKRFL